MRILLATAWIALMAAFPVPASAHQPNIVEGNLVNVESPEVSRAYYGELDGAAVKFRVTSDAPFRLYIGLLVPKEPDARTDWQVDITRDGVPVATLDAGSAEWGEFHEEFAGDDYLKGPEYSADVGAGAYEVTVDNPDSSGKFVLAVGEAEVWGIVSLVDSLRVIPKLKTGFFGHATAAGFLLSIFGAASFALSASFGLVVGIAVRRKFVKLDRRHENRNLGTFGRLLRLFAAVALVAVGLVWWCLGAVAVGAFLIYEGLSGWCAAKAMTKRDA